MEVLAPGLALADLEFQQRRRVIAAGILQGRDGVAIVDPGPTSTLPTLRRRLADIGASVRDVTVLLVTHIHLDHAGATGTLVRENPRIRVYVHQVGAPHLADPSKLVNSATRLYGHEMESLWGEVAATPASALVALGGGERLECGGRAWEVAYTPGHASHHVCFFDRDSGVAFVGDTGGVQVVPGGFVLPPTPPPDIDLPQWFRSLEAIEAWHPRSLVMTHFGVTNDVPAHLAELRDHLRLCEQLATEALEAPGDDAAREGRFLDTLRLALSRRMTEADLRGYEMAGRFDLNWRGLHRYLTRRRGA